MKLNKKVCIWCCRSFGIIFNSKKGTSIVKPALKGTSIVKPALKGTPIVKPALN
jgi:hypothetical protein